MNNIAILASGSGTNAENIVKYFKGHPNISIRLIATENPKAYVIERAKKLNIEHYIFSISELKNGSLLNKLKSLNIDFIVLAGFLKLVPSDFVNAYKNRIVNIHPALLPKYGGKGMFGMNVHKAVIENHEKESGISIHFVSSNYDEGNIIFQAKCKVDLNDSPDSLASKVHKLEYLHYPAIIEKVILKHQQ